MIRPSAALLLVALAAACGPGPEPPPADRIHLAAVGPETVLVGSTLRLTGSGFLRGETVTASFAGGYAGAEVAFDTDLAYVSSTELTLPVDGAFTAALGAPEGTFSGTVTLSVVRDGVRLEHGRSVVFAVVRALTPVLRAVDPTAVALMETVALDGDGFLLGGEGTTEVLLAGTFTPSGGAERALPSRTLPVAVEGRTRLTFVWSPDLVGLAPGTARLHLEVVNRHAGPGGDVSGAGLTETVTVVAPSVASVSPTAASRGQRLEILGRGFLPAVPEAGQLTGLSLVGTFTEIGGDTLRFTEASPLEVFPDYDAPGRLVFVVRPEQKSDGTLTGLGSAAGVFDGQVRVDLRRGTGTYLGPPWTGRLEILPTRQVVFLKILPGFGDALRRFGLYNVDRELRDRILEVCRRDYEDFNVEFRETRPTDFADYSVIELMGVDPNGAGLFGLDNTEGKDEGNLRLDDVVGGRNAESEEQGYYAFGGVFLESFLAFSPSLPEHAPIASPAFDAIFSPFVPELGGTEVAAGEYPGGSRDAKVAEAIRVLGNLVGNTVVHEIGHSLGLAAIPGSYHHDGSTPGLMMNPGSARPFEERAEIDHAPAVWGEVDRAYLEQVLPKN